jgi:hypothetical protein
MAVKGYKIAVGTLTDKYARLKGELEVLEKDAEDANGVAEIDEAIVRIDRRRREIEDSLMHIEEVVWLFDQSWDPAAVRPIRLQRVKFPPGAISKAAYDVLRRAARPMSTREIAREVAVSLGIEELTETNIAPIDIAIASNLPRRVGDGIQVEEGPPRLWSVMRSEAPPAQQGADAANSHAIRPRRVA